MDDALRSLLMQHDDGTHWEYPAGFDYGRATNRFAAFASALSAELLEPVATENGTPASRMPAFTAKSSFPEALSDQQLRRHDRLHTRSTR